MSQISYNGIILPYANITRFTQEALGDGVSDTDWYLMKFDVAVQCTVNLDYLALLAPGVVPASVTSAADIMRLIRFKLMQRRKTLSLLFNGRELIPQVQLGLPGTVDANNGPMPKSFTYMQVTNTTFIINYHIVAHYWESLQTNTDGFNQNGNVVLFNRWTEVVDIDNCQFTTRSRAGKVVIRSDNAQGLVADQIRLQMAAVSVPFGFLRKKSQYKVDPSGLGLEYSITDEEQFKMPPPPAYEAEGYYLESTPPPYGALRYGEVFVRLKGSGALGGVAAVNAAAVNVQAAGGAAGGGLGAFAAPQGVTNLDTESALIAQCISVANKKLLARKIGTAIFTILHSASLKVEFYKNEVEFRMKVMMSQDGQQVGPDPFRKLKAFVDPIVSGVNGARGALGGQGPQPPPDPPVQNAQGGRRTDRIAAFAGVSTFVPGSDDQIPRYQPQYFLRGTAGFLLQAAAYYDPSLAATVMDGQQLSTGLQPGQAGVNKEP